MKDKLGEGRGGGRDGTVVEQLMAPGRVWNGKKASNAMVIVPIVEFGISGSGSVGSAN